MDAENTDFADQSFDLVCGTGILHHLDLEKAYSELARILKPGGRAIFLEPLGHNPLINLYRKLTPSLRSQDEHPLKIKDLRFARQFFNRIRIKYFHLLILMAVPFRSTTIFEFLINILGAIDGIIFTLAPLLRRYAWTAVMEFYDPNNSGYRDEKMDDLAVAD
jgi:SAM-dependent methyltransferase